MEKPFSVVSVVESRFCRLLGNKKHLIANVFMAFVVIVAACALEHFAVGLRASNALHVVADAFITLGQYLGAESVVVAVTRIFVAE